MPTNNFNTGRDLTLVLVGPYGILTINGITEVSRKKEETVLKHKGIDGKTVHAVIPDSHEFSINLERKDPLVEQYFARLEADYFAGVNTTGGTIMETTQESDGSVSQYRYEDVVLKLDNAGSYKGDTFVSMGITAMASRKIRVV